MIDCEKVMGVDGNPPWLLVADIFMQLVVLLGDTHLPQHLQSSSSMA